MADLQTPLAAALAGRYRIERELGAGGMATVYLAHDLKHERNVALKVLLPDLAQSVGAERFLAEIKTTARLQHPHILALYDSGEAAGNLFYVMPLVEGESLRERLDRDQKLPVEEARRVASEVADALSYGHAQGVVHRDIKPENIMLAAGHALVADFGIARAVSAAGSQRLTQAGMTLGTAAYMSPEQASGEERIDARSDVYSLACVLYEMLAGEPPFTGPSAAAVIAQRFTKTAPSVIVKVGNVPRSIDAAIRMAMAREPGDRFQSAAEFAVALAGKSVPYRNGEDAKKSIAVLPFTNMSADPDAEFFSDGIAEEILNALVRLPGLRVIARTSSFAFKGKNVDIREIGEKLGAGMVLEGSVRRAANRLRITAQLIDAAGGHHLWSERYDREMKDVFEIQDEITLAIRDALSEKILGIEKGPRISKALIDAETYELFLRGRFHIAKRAEGMEKGMEYLGQVVARAPTYAPAYAELATAYSLLTVYGAIPAQVGWPKVRELAEVTLSLDPNSARAHAELGNVAFLFDWDWKEARAHYEHAIALDANDPWVHMLLGHYSSSLGRHEEAVWRCQRAASLDPLNPSVRVSLAITHFLARRYEEAIAVCDQIIDLDAAFSESHRWKGKALRHLGRRDEARGPTEAAVRLSGRHQWAVSDEAILHAAAGRTDVALALLQELMTRSAPQPTRPLAIALIYAELGDLDQYFEWMERSYAARDAWLAMLNAEPEYDRGRADPRHEALVQRVGIPASS